MIFVLLGDSTTTLLEDRTKTIGITGGKVNFLVSWHMFITMLITLVVDLYTVSILMEYANIETTKIYAPKMSIRRTLMR